MSDAQLDMQAGTAPALENLSPGQAARFGVDLCDALLENTPERGFHGALHPNNLTYAPDGGVTLGAALELDGEYSPDELEYLAPELFWNGVGGPATDVYAIGLLLYTACSDGRPAFTGESGELTGEVRAAAATRRLKGEALREPRDAGNELAQVILRAVAYKEEERWPDVESLRGALEDCCEFAPETKPNRRTADAIAAAAGAAAVLAVDRAAEAAKTAAEQKAAAETAPAQKPQRGKKGTQEIPEGHPRPVYDVFNEKKKSKKRSPLPAIATILALVVIFCAVLYLFKGEDTPDPGVSEPTPPVTTPDLPVEDDPTPNAPVTEPDAGEDEPTPEVTPEPEPVFSVALTHLGSASRDEAAAMAAAEGGHLPVIRDREDLEALIAAADAAGVSYVWLDAKRGTDGVWRSSDGEEVSYLPWFEGEPSRTDTDGTAENCLMLWKFKGVWGYNDMRSDPGTTYPKYYGGKIAVFCQED